MTGSVQGSAIDDSFETLTNAPDAWISGRYAAPPPVDYQHYVEPGDARSAVDDRCPTEYGAIEHTHHVRNATKPAKTDQKRHRSRQTSTKPAPRDKRRPSPAFRIRSKDGDSVIMSNPFVLRKPSRPRPSDAVSQSEQSASSQHSSATSSHSQAYKIRIRGKNGEEAIHEIKRPLHFASQETTVVEDESAAENVKYWPANPSSPSQERSQKHMSKSGPTTFTDFVMDPATAAPSTVGSSVKMSGALPYSSAAPATYSSRSGLLPPEKPASSKHDSVMSDSGYLSKIPSRSISHHSQESPKNSSRVSSQKDYIIVPDESLEGSVAASFSALSTRCILSSRPISPVSTAKPSEVIQDGNDAATTSDCVSSQSPPFNKAISKSLSRKPSATPAKSSRTSKPFVTSQLSKQAQEDLNESGPASVSLSKHKEPKQEAYYNWKVPKDSLYSNSTRDSRSPPQSHVSVASRETISPSSKTPGYSGGIPLDIVSEVPSSARSGSPQTLPQWNQPSPSSLATRFSGAKEDTNIWVPETVSERSQQESSRGQSAHCIPLPSSRTSLSKRASRSSSSSFETPTRLASRISGLDDQRDRPVSEAAAMSVWTESRHFERSFSRQKGQEAAGWGEAAEWEEMPSSSHSSKTSRASRSHQSRSHRSESSHHDSYEGLEQEHDQQGSLVETEKGSKRTSKSTSSIDVEEDLLPYLPPSSDDEPLPPPMPMLTTIYEESEPGPSSHAPSMLTQETTQFARPGAITPHPLSSVSSASTARKPPSIEPHRLDYQRPYVESRSSSSASSGAHKSSRTRRSSRPRMLEEQAYRSAKELGSHISSKKVSESVRTSRKSRTSAKVSVGGWKLW